MSGNKKNFINKHWLKLVVSIMCISVFISSLFFVNVGIVNAAWNTQSKIEGFSINNATKSFQETLYIFIDNSSLYAEELRLMLSENLVYLQTNVEVLYSFNETIKMKNASFLGIDVEKISYDYYPWSSNVEYSIFYYFSTVGNTKYFNGFKTAESMYDHPAVVFNSSDDEQISKQLLNIGEIDIQGKLDGFFSIPKSTDILIEHIA